MYDLVVLMIRIVFVLRFMLQVFLKINSKTFTVKNLEEKVLKSSLNMIAPDVTIDDNSGTIMISSDEDETEGNNDKPLNVMFSSIIYISKSYQFNKVSVCVYDCRTLACATGLGSFATISCRIILLPL